MNVAIVLAGGVGKRMGYDIPKQFIKVFDKPILAYTLEIFEKNENIDAIEVVCHKDYKDEVKDICDKYKITKFKYLVDGGSTFQESTVNGILNLREELKDDDICCISFGVSPLTPSKDIDDSIRVAKEHGNGISAADMDLCTCIKDDEYKSSKSILRETLKGFANPWSFKYGELRDSYLYAIENNLLDKIEPHTTSLYYYLGKEIWFSSCTTTLSKITHKSDLELFEGYELLRRQKNDKL